MYKNGNLNPGQLHHTGSGPVCRGRLSPSQRGCPTSPALAARASFCWMWYSWKRIEIRWVILRYFCRHDSEQLDWNNELALMISRLKLKDRFMGSIVSKTNGREDVTSYISCNWAVVSSLSQWALPLEYHDCSETDLIWELLSTGGWL